MYNERALEIHEVSTEHKKSIFTWITSKSITNASTLMSRLTDKKERTSNIILKSLTKVIRIITFLSERHLPFKDHSKTWLLSNC